MKFVKKLALKEKNKNTPSVWFDNDFEIASKYHRKIVVLFLKARIFSLQDVVFPSLFFLVYLLKYLTEVSSVHIYSG